MKNWGIATIQVLCVTLFLSSCIPTPTASKSLTVSTNSTDSSTDEDEELENRDNDYNHFIVQETRYTNSMSLPYDFDDYAELRGQDINSFIESYGGNKTLCYVAPYVSLGKALVISLFPRTDENFTDLTSENYYLMAPNNSGLNSTHCLTSDIVMALDTNYSLEAVSSFSELCGTSCTGQTLSSGSNFVMTNGGITQSDIRVSNIGIRIFTDTLENDAPNIPVMCVEDLDCSGQGSDYCCVSSSCVVDGATRPDVNTSSEGYLEAIAAVMVSPANKKNYPQYFYNCATAGTPDFPEDEIDQTEEELEHEALQRFIEKEELFNCTTPQYDDFGRIISEVGFCTKTIENIESTNTEIHSTQTDDLNFENTYMGTLNLYSGIGPKFEYGNFSSITKVTYSGEELDSSQFIIDESSSNSSLSSSTNIKLNLSSGFTTSYLDKQLKIQYRNNATCELISDGLYQCDKYYVIGKDDSAKSVSYSSYYPASDLFMTDHSSKEKCLFENTAEKTEVFLLPKFTNFSRPIEVYIDGTKYLPSAGWNEFTCDKSSLDSIKIDTTNIPLSSGQLVQIKYYVDETEESSPYLSKQTALERIQELCQCSSADCSLEPVYKNDDLDSDIIDYSCVYPDATGVTIPPLDTTVSVTGKNIPMRYFTTSGSHVSSDRLDAGTDPLENYSGKIDSDGNPLTFKYNSDEEPNNVNNYVGFTEIYGTIKGDDSNAPKPPVELEVIKGKTYNLFVNTGIFIPCPGCGRDYYTDKYKQLFPSSYDAMGGGYIPDDTATSNRDGIYRRDDLLYGRACFVPATMIPWTHKGGSSAAGDSVQDQRINRMKAQHFMFANGYQRDWYGFDYGALIGSFDGVTWFAVGSQRRITATTNRMYLAINSYFADLNRTTSYSVRVTEDANLPANSRPRSTYDFGNDGAYCQQLHVCETDQDCASQLGWEYSCEDPKKIETKWPEFDINAQELIGEKSINLYQTLQSSFSGKRCVYRARGAPCAKDFTNPGENGAYADTGTNNYGLYACNTNYACKDIESGDDSAAISRWENTPEVRNLNNELGTAYTETYNSSITLANDTLGLAANILGRPQKRYTMSSSTSTNLENNNLISICVPGRNPGSDSSTFVELNEDVIGNNDSDFGDKLNGMGLVPGNDVNFGQYYLSCPTFDESGNYVHQETTPATDSGIQNLSISQNTTVWTLNNIEDWLNDDMKPVPYNVNLQEDRNLEKQCLRLPGAVCFSDRDCAANPNIVDNLGQPDYDEEKSEDKSETLFWKEEMICSQEYEKSDPNWVLNNNRCCREKGKDITAPSFSNDNDKTFNIAGIKVKANSGDVLTRYANIYKDLSTGGDLEGLTPTHNTETSTPKEWDDSENPNNGIANRFKTFQKTLSMQCCTGNWVRKFHEDNTIGGKGVWDSRKLQTTPKESFSCYNWDTCGEFCDPDKKLNCNFGDIDNPEDPNCRARSLYYDDYEPIQNWLADLELTGIPQATISTGVTTAADTTISNLTCKIYQKDDAFDQSSIGTTPPFDFFINSDVLTRDSYYSRIIQLSGLEGDTSFATGISENSPYYLEMSTTSQGFRFWVEYDNGSTNLTRPNSDKYDTNNDHAINVKSGDSIATIMVEVKNTIESTYYSSGTYTGYTATAPIFTNKDVGKITESETGHGKFANKITTKNTGTDDIRHSRSIDFSGIDESDNDINSSDDYFTISTKTKQYLVWYDVGNANPGSPIASIPNDIEIEILNDYTRQQVIDATILALANKEIDARILEFTNLKEGSNLYEENSYNETPSVFDSIEVTTKASNYEIKKDSYEYIDDSTDAEIFVSGANMAHFNEDNVKEIFDKDKFKCCIPVGSDINDTDDDSLCCSGYSVTNTETTGKKTCKLKNYTDLSVFFNAYVSSMAKDVKETYFNSRTGYLSREKVSSLACAINACESGVLAYGIAVSNLPVKGFEKNSYRLPRFIDQSGEINDVDKYFDAGLKWNTHVYCAPTTLSDANEKGDFGMTILTCP